MPGIDLLLTNLLQPIVLAFLLGIIAGFLKNEIEVPPDVIKALAIFLLFAIGINGGRALAEADLDGILRLVGVTLLMVVLIPTIAYLVMRRLGRFDVSNSAAIAAHYGSVSTATFFSAMTFAAAMATPAAGYMAAMVALMEFAIIFSLLIARVGMMRESKLSLDIGGLLMSVLRGRGVLLLSGGMAIGYVASDRQFAQIEPFYDGLFRGILMLFLLEMGITAARQFHAFRQVGLFMLGFGVMMPVIFGLVGVTAAHYLAGAGIGVAFVFGAMCASASFVDAPAACRASLPEASPGIYVTASLGITLPFNLLLGLPLLYGYATWLTAL